MSPKLTGDEMRRVAKSLAEQGVSGGDFQRAGELVRELGSALARAYGEVLEREVTPLQFADEVLGVEGAGRLLVQVLRKVTGRPDLYSEI
ncbi:hypothetical protein OK074_2087 [Actinobacteria bacterium OK074]|nr:hypothetical protein OK074_2087 [Actinobacteria bacterium OK074]